MSNQLKAPTLNDYTVYDDMMLEAQRLITLARFQRGSYLSKEIKDFTVVVTQFKLVKGEYKGETSTKDSNDPQFAKDNTGVRSENNGPKAIKYEG